MSGDPEQEYFTDGITEDIITELSRFHSLFVIARNSSFSYKGKSPDIRQVGRELGVRYVLEGSIRKSSNRIRVTGQLIDTLTGNHIWAERYDRVLEDIFAVQEEVTRAIVAAIAPQIEFDGAIEGQLDAAPTISALTKSAFGRGRMRGRTGQGGSNTFRSGDSRGERSAGDRPEQRAGTACTCLCLRNGSVPSDGSGSGACPWEAMWAAARAIELDSTDALGYALRGFGVLLGGQLDRYPEALADARRAHEMNPNDTFVLRFLGLEAGLGEHERAIEHGHQILRLNPRDSRSHDDLPLAGLCEFRREAICRGHWLGVACAQRHARD